MEGTATKDVDCWRAMRMGVVSSGVDGEDLIEGAMVELLFGLQGKQRLSGV